MILTANVDFNDLLITTDAVVRHQNAASAVLLCQSDVLPCYTVHRESISVLYLLATWRFWVLDLLTPNYVACMAVSVAKVKQKLQACLAKLPFQGLFML